MITAQTLLKIIDQCLALTGLPETTLSYRIFEDTKKIADLRRGRDITLGRFGMAMRWLAANWPAGHALPEELQKWVPEPPKEEDAA
jgi:hypothetical protein